MTLPKKLVLLAALALSLAFAVGSTAASAATKNARVHPAGSGWDNHLPPGHRS